MIYCQDGCFMFCQRCTAEEYLSHNLDEHCLEDTGARQRRGFSPEQPRATRFAWCLSYLIGGHHSLGATFLSS